MISTANIVYTYVSFLTLSVHSHSLILRYSMILDYIHHPMICLRRYSNYGLANGFFMMSACCSFVSIYNNFDLNCLICSLKRFLFILKLHINRIMCTEVESDYFGSIYQTSSLVKYFIPFSIAFMKSSQSSAFIASKSGDYFFEKFLLQEFLGPQD